MLRQMTSSYLAADRMLMAVLQKAGKKARRSIVRETERMYRVWYVLFCKN